MLYFSVLGLRLHTVPGQVQQLAAPNCTALPVGRMLRPSLSAAVSGAEGATRGRGFMGGVGIQWAAGRSAQRRASSIGNWSAGNKFRG